MLKALGYPVLVVGVVMALRTFSPSEPAPFVPAPATDDLATLPSLETAPAPAVKRLAMAEIVPPKPVLVTRRVTSGVSGTVAPASATVTISPWRTAIVTSEGSANGTDRYELIRSIQRELRRTGCYWGVIDGSWGGASKRALAAFMDRVNATLPIAEPDYVLLALIRAQPGAACSAPCPRGQSFDYGSRCVPDTVLAQARRNGVTRTASTAVDAGTQVAWTAEVRPSAGGGVILPPLTPLAGRMSIGGPRPVAQFADVPESELSVPARSGATYTTASLSDGGDPRPQIDSATGLPPELMPAAVPPTPRAAKAAKPSRRAERRTRSVHQLFMHPLGQM